MQFQLSPENIIAITSALIAVIFARFPILRTKFAAISTEAKSGIMLGLMAIVVLGVYLLQCYGWIDAGITCDKIGLQQIVTWYVLAVISNQATYMITPQAKDVKAAKVIQP